VINATSDPFYMNWLRTMNVLTHCTIITIGDPTRAEAEEYFNTHLVHSLRKKLEQQQQSAIICETRDRPPSGNMVLKHERDQASAQKESSPAHHHPQDTYELGFELIYDTFGGKLAHMQGFVGDYRKPEVPFFFFFWRGAMKMYELMICGTWFLFSSDGNPSEFWW
jgi:hypothetical protein